MDTTLELTINVDQNQAQLLQEHMQDLLTVRTVTIGGGIWAGEDFKGTAILSIHPLCSKKDALAANQIYYELARECRSTSGLKGEQLEAFIYGNEGYIEAKKNHSSSLALSGMLDKLNWMVVRKDARIALQNNLNNRVGN